jgi:hypothetical protein
MPDGTQNGTSTTDGGGGLKSTMAVVVALLALLALAISIYALWGKADDAGNETAWARWTFLLAGIEAIAFAGAGWLFGREVNRAAAERSQEAQQEATKQASHAADAESRGRALRSAVIAKAASAGGNPGAPDLLGTGATQNAPAEWQELSTLARELFPSGDA